MAVGIEEYLQQLLGVMGSGTNDLRNLETVFRSLNQQTSTLGTLQREGVGAINSFKQGMSGLKSAGNLSQVMTAVSGLNAGFDRIVTGILSAGKIFVTKLIGGFADAVTYMNEMIQRSMGGFEGAMRAQIGLIATTISKGIGGSLGPKLGGMIGSVLETALQAFKIMFDERLKRSEASFSLWAAGVEGPHKGAARNAADTLMSAFEEFTTREKGAEFVQAGAGRGITGQEDILGAGKIGRVMQMGGEETMKHLETQIIMYGKGDKALKSMKNTFEQMRDVAKATGLPIKDLIKGVEEAAAGSRFLNADMSLVNNTMSLMAKNQKGLASQGVDLRQQQKGMLDDMSGASGKITDEMHAFFGSEGGKTDAMQGWMKSRYGEDFAEKAKVGPGGLISGTEDAGPSKMMEQRLTMIKNMMAKAAESAGGDAAKSIYIQREMAMKLGLGESSAALLMRTELKDIKGIADNPKVLSEMKTEKESLQDLREMASIDQAIQRMMANLSAQQVTLALAGVRIAQIQLDKSLHPKKYENLFGTKTKEGEAAALEIAKLTKVGTQAFSSLLAGESEMSKMLYNVVFTDKDQQEILKSIGTDAAASLQTQKGESWIPGTKAFGGSISAYIPRFATGGAIVGEQGPEYFKPSIPGEISSNRDLMNAASTGRGNKDVTINITMPALSGPDLIAQINSSLRGL